MEKLQSIKTKIFQESPDFQKFLEPFITELNRAIILESGIALQQPQTKIFLSLTLRKRFEFFEQSVFLKNLFGTRDLEVTENVVKMVSQLELLQKRSLERMLWVRRLLCHFSRLAKAEIETGKVGQSEAGEVRVGEGDFRIFKFVVERGADLGVDSKSVIIKIIDFILSII